MKKYYCTICGREHDGKHHTKYCRKHQGQIEKYGKVLDNNPRSKFDPNEFIFEGEIVKFHTYKAPEYNIDQTYIIDSEDYPLVSKYKWRTDKAGYATTNVNNHTIFLHRLIMDATPGQQIDHINLDIKDNRKVNLRIADNSLNQSNKRGYNTLKVKGVQYHAHINKYSAYFRNGGKQYHSPCYSTIEEAAFARFILEQTFRDDKLTQFSEDLINTLPESTKEKIILDVKKKFNIN